MLCGQMVNATQQNRAKLRFGLIGCGGVGPTHAGALLRIEEAELVAVADLIPQRANELATKLGREPTLEEIAKEAELTPADVQALRDAARTVTSLDRPVGEEGDTALRDLVASSDPEPGEEVFFKMRETLVRETIGELPEMEQKVLRRRYGLNGSPEPQTLAAIGRELGVSAERVRQIEERALAHLALRRELQALSDAA